MSAFDEAFTELLAVYREVTGRTGTVVVNGTTYDGLPSEFNHDLIPMPGMESESGGATVQCRAADFSNTPPAKFTTARIEDRDAGQVLSVSLANSIYIISVGDPTANE